ncbi:c-type cytochrome [Variovorax guangxiensis]|uniref:Cytochrome c4 n=1 Tax=Variovorax guangxiensis TaxID=1775474 RepID=A0A502DVW5_9BURK|nr:c-type cytochrome [Variovorax guangxiensis]RZI67550.1 MAG: cytochrome c4 [Variovorax sp.]TPG24252.1 cytochrome c4 [Variovorax ginsengisoli]TPG28502.1 cytochrome c4 [Variovorax guangxiensis]
MKLFAHFLLAALMGAAASTGFAADEKAAAPAAAAPAKPAKPDPAKGDTIFNATPANSQSCASCHNADGNSAIPANPKLAQQHPEYILKQLQEFKSGKRKSAIMKPYASALSDEDMRNIAWFVGSKTVKPGFAKEKDLVTLGEKIYRGGIADRMIPACASCHSPNGAGLPAQYPRLGGQHADYTAAQLVAFRDGVRANSAPMTGVAAKLNDREIKAVSDYIAGLR